MASAKEHRRYAAQYLALAQTAATSEDRARLLQMVQAWIELAEKLSTQSHSAAIGRLARTRAIRDADNDRARPARLALRDGSK